jgi:hypothetical protein
MTEPIHKIIITGTGRTGTTFLVQLLTELGLDTGYTRQSWPRDYFAHCEAGLERDILAAGSPYIVKNPEFCATLPALLATGHFAIDHVLVPIRELSEAAQSRIRIGGADGDVPGGLMGTADPAAQKGVLAENFHGLMHTLADHDIPYTLLHFPRFARDGDYAFAKLHFLVPRVGRDAFDAAFRRVSRPELIHDFSALATERNGVAAGKFYLAEKRKRARRRTKRLAAAIVILGAALMAARILNVRASATGAAAGNSPIASSAAP